jgi:two-component system nitrate/nitrite response regulator NarL
MVHSERRASVADESIAGSGPRSSRATRRSAGRVRLLVVDDHPVVRQGICFCLRSYPHLQVVGEAGDGLEALSLARKLLPDIILMDFDMPQINGLAATEAVRKQLPKIKVLMLSAYAYPEYVQGAIQAGAQGYVLKEASPTELAQAIETVLSCEAFYSPGFAGLALKQLGPDFKNRAHTLELTPREREVLTSIAQGLSNNEIAARFDIGVRTVETHRQGLMRKLDIRSVAALTRFAVARGLVPLGG